MQEAAEKVAEAEAKGREAQEENKRLQDHIHDLETRKRAPLYQVPSLSSLLTYS